MIYKAFRYVQDLHVGDETIAEAAGRELPEGEYFAFPLGEGVNNFVNGAVVQVNTDGTARFLRIG